MRAEAEPPARLFAFLNLRSFTSGSRQTSQKENAPSSNTRLAPQPAPLPAPPYVGARRELYNPQAPNCPAHLQGNSGYTPGEERAQVRRALLMHSCPNVIYS